MAEKFLSLRDVLERACLSKAEIYRRAKAGAFPKPVPLGRYKVVFVASEIDAWMESRIAARDADEGKEERRARALKAVEAR